MLHPSPATASLLTRFCALALAYLLLLSLGAPMSVRRAEAAAPLSSAHAATDQSAHNAARRDGELLVRFRQGSSEAERTAAVEQHGGQRGQHLHGRSGLERITLKHGQDLDATIVQLRSERAVELVEPNYLVTKDQTGPNDPRIGEQWALRNIGQTGGQTGADIGADTAWATTTGNSATVIAVIDSGIDFTHPDLTNNQWTNPQEQADGQDDDHDGFIDDLHGWDWVTNSNQIVDQNGHGTSVAGIIAAEGNNNIGVSGVMWHASLMSLRVLDNTGTGDVANAVEAIDYAVAHGAQVINMSWGTDGASQALQDAISRASASGVVVVCSAGNSGRNIDSTPYYPSSYNLPNVLSVAATDNTDTLASWSNWGASVAVAAPGVNILTTKPGGDYQTISGTSAATPLVSGVAGLVKTANPQLNGADVRTAIINGVRQSATLNGKVSSGGIVSAGGALSTAGTIVVNGGGDSGSGNNGGNDGGNNNGGGNGQQQGAGGPSPTPGPPGRGSGNLTGTSADPSHSAPPGFINQDEERTWHMPAPQAPTFIHADDLAQTCDVTCGGDAPPSGGGTDPYFATARLRPQNKKGDQQITPQSVPSGTTKENLGSRNFNWGAPLVSLPGRGGLDLNISLYYNSLVWTNQNNMMMYNADNGFPGPGFHLGFPTVQASFTDADLGVNSYLLLTPSGGAVELRQVGATSTYESADGTYTQLTDLGNGTLTVRTPDGTQMTFVSFPAINEYRCTQIKDRNGNYITINYGPITINNVAHTDTGRPTSVIDTLGRTINFNYDGQGYLISISQLWNGATHNWATFNYHSITLQPNFPGLGVLANSSIPVLDTVGFADSSSFQFLYEDGWGMVRQINHRGQTARVISYTSYNIPVTGTALTDSPRFTERHDWAEMWNGDTDALPTSSEEAITYFNEASDNSWTTETFPDGTMHKELFATVGWQKGQSTGSEDYDQSGVKQKWTSVSYSLPISNLGFESPAVGAGAYQYNPTGGSWTFNGNAGISGNSSGFTSGNPAAPEGSQVAFLQTTGTISQSNITGFQANASYVVRFWAAQRANYGGFQQNFQVWLDNVLLGTFQPVGANYQELTTSPFTATAGPHTLQFVGLNSAGGDNTVFLDNVQITAPGSAPVPLETNIYDSQGNRRRTSIAYTNFSLPSGALCSLPSDTFEYTADAATVLRQTHTNYKTDSSYLNQRLIGLPTSRYVYDGSGVMYSGTVYDYDYLGSSYLSDTATAAVQHDAAYGTSFQPRGNMTLQRVVDATDPNNTGKFHDTLMSYNTTGGLTSATDPLGHKTSIAYTDNFSDGINHNTYAYPTTLTDADNYASTSQYHYDFGAVTQTQDPKGAVITMTYDTAGRRSQVTNQFTGAYTRWEYDIDNGHTRTYTSINAGAPPENFATNTAYTNTIVDGLGQVRLFVANHPGSTGTYLAVQYTHDNMGRVTQQSNPTEITGGGVPTGDDAAAGYVNTSQSYDWKGRPLVTTYPDTHTTQLSYGGCGCAGGEVTTTHDERGRQKRYTKDSLGRLAKVEELNWDGSVYATTTYAYNPLDQLTNSTEQGQTRSLEYDGYGRLSARTTPEQGRTTYSYFSDDTTQTVTDARGATTTFAYNNRHLATAITYGVPAGVAATNNVSLTYDEAGNRTSMSNGVELAQYHYDTSSRLDWEQFNFPGLDANWYRLSYTYNLANEVTRITNPWNTQVAYTYDGAGRVTTVQGTDTSNNPTYYSIPTYAQSLVYRAFGGLKSMTYGDATYNNQTLSLSYDNRLRLTQWNVPGLLGWSYAYDKFSENSNRVTYAQNLTDATLNRSYDYDQVGRLWEAHSGNEADAHVAGQPFPSQPNGPYSHSYRYDEWGNMTYRVGWGGEDGSYLNWTQSFTNNRLTTNPGTGQAMQYDASGNLTSDGSQTYQYDATGQQTYASTNNLTQSYDGDGLRVKKVESGAATYYLRSSVLGQQVVAELTASNYWARGYVYLGGQLLAVQAGGVFWVQTDPITKSQRITNSSGTVTSTVDLDPWGGETSRSSNQAFQPHRFTTYERDGNGGDEAMFRRYQGYWMRMAQPDPFNGSYDLTDPQSFNRYSYTSNDPVNLIDPSGLTMENPGFIPPSQNGWNQTTNPTLDFLNGAARDFVADYNWFQEEAGGMEFEGFPLITGWGQQGRRPLPVVSPHQEKERQRQQEGFNDCARSRIREFKRTEYGNVANIAAGTVAATLAWRLGAGAEAKLGELGLAKAIGFAPKILPRSIQLAPLLAGGLRASEWLSGNVAYQAFQESRANNAKLDQALADCRSQFPLADHSTWRIYATTF